MPSALIQAIFHVMGEERGRRDWTFKDMKAAEVLMAGGSDWPVIGLPDLWFGMQVMIARANPRAPELRTLWPERAIDLETAIEIYTINVARGMGVGDLCGSIAHGKFADLIVLVRNLF
jgi:predicted amidohydrolase YtcJ